MTRRLLPLLFALLKFGSGYFLISPAYELQRDEYLYLNHGRHLAWGYLEIPPLTAVQGALSMAVGGEEWAVKFWPFLWGAATIYLVVRLAGRLGGGWFGPALAGACYLATAFARLNLLFQPNSFEVFGFVLAQYALVAYGQEEKPRWLYVLGVALGLGLLNKYTTLFFIAALGGALLLTPARRLLTNKHFWGAALLAGLLWLPNVGWQIQHGVPFRHHMALLKESQLVHVSALDYWKAQLLMCFPALWVWGPGLLALFFYQGFRPYRALGWVAVLGVGLLFALSGKDYYALGYYPVLFAAGAAWWAQRLGSWPAAAWKTALQGAFVALPLAIMAPLAIFVYPLRPPAEMAAQASRYQQLGFYRWEDGQNHPLPQDYADMLGWRELATKTRAAYRALPPEVRAHTLIHCANYGQASAINYYNRGRALPQASSFNGSFLYWYPGQEQFRAIIIVDDEPDDALAPHFARYYRAGSISNPYARERGTALTVGLRPDSTVQLLLRREWRQARAAWEGGQ
jgi:hypothetical protein